MTNPRLMSVSEAAAYLGVSPASLRKWSNSGLVPTYRTPGGQRRYSVEDLDSFMRSMREPKQGAPSEPRDPSEARAESNSEGE
jgi:excisionase family DNA binding protein